MNTHNNASSASPEESIPPTKARYYIVRHWKGELGLGASFWWSCLTINLLLLLILIAIFFFSRLVHPIDPLAYLSIYWASIFLMFLWAGVGCWRSASNSIKKYNKKFWPWLVKSIILIELFLFSLILALQDGPIILEHINMRSGDNQFGPTIIRSLNETEAEFFGAFRYGSAREVGKLLMENPRIKTIHLNSEGGRIAEAVALRDLFRRRHIDTYTEIQCLSACTVAFIGGEKRFMKPSARFGFHRSSSPGTIDGAKAGDQQNKLDMIWNGVEANFAEKAYLPANTEMWFPTPEELLASHFVTDYANGQFFASETPANFLREYFSFNLKNNALFQAISEIYPSRFDAIVDVFVKGTIDNKDKLLTMQDALLLTADTVKESLISTSDEAIIASSRSAIDMNKAADSIDPERCYNTITDTSISKDVIIDGTGIMDEPVAKAGLARTIHQAA